MTADADEDVAQAMSPDIKTEKTAADIKHGVVTKQQITEALILIKRETRKAVLV